MRLAEETSFIVNGLSSFLQQLGHQMPLLDARRAGAEMYGASRLSLYELMRPNENALSRIVADLFDPRGTHGQGALFLNALLGKLDLPRVRVGAGVRVRREVLTYNRRRIDIVVETPEVLLGIENKPWAGQQPNQLPDYHCDLAKRAGGRCFALLFLSDQDEDSARGKVIRMPYQPSHELASLHSVLSSVAGSIRATRARAHIDDFIRYIETQFGEGQVTEEGDEPYVEAVQAEFDSNRDKKKAVAAVMLAQSKLHARILEEIGNFVLRELREKIDKDFTSEETGKIYDRLGERWAYWPLSRPSWPANCHICLESSEGDFNKVYVGVRAPDPASEKIDLELGCKARPKLEGLQKKVSNGRKSVWWPWLALVATYESIVLGARVCRAPNY